MVTMPMFDYTCGKCRHAFEHLARRLDEPSPACPECGSGKVEKAMSAPAVGVGSSGSKGSALPMGGGCCPCGKSAGACSRG